jgi:hypothetical protein
MWTGDVEHRGGGYMIFLENLKKNYFLLDGRVDERIILNWIYKKVCKLWMGMI